jgi:hypothetical protein
VSARPGKEREQTPWTACRIAKIEVIGAGIVEVDRPLYQSEPEQTREEIQVTLRIARNGGDMMDATHPLLLHSHAPEMPAPCTLRKEVRV